MIRCNNYGKTTTIAPTTTTTTAPATKTTTTTTTTAPATKTTTPTTTTTTKKPEPTSTEPYDICDDFEPPVSISQGPLFYAKRFLDLLKIQKF